MAVLLYTSAPVARMTENPGPAATAGEGTMESQAALEAEAQAPDPGAALAALYSDAGQIADWALQPVLNAYEAGLLVGSGGRFRPLAPVTRAELATILSRLDETLTRSAVALGDVPEGAWYRDDAVYAVEAGLLDAPGGTLRPQHAATREEVAAAVSRLYALDTKTAQEALAAGAFAIEDLTWAVAAYRPCIAAVFHEGIMVGHGANFRPKASITRQEMAKVLGALLT
ncbi:MAG: S-layer homology domain-containing protein [Oscillospiraceae bacterium]|nr:S-layer homology domain-containing protein [Oscillospiraceae bacterium]